MESICSRLRPILDGCATRLDNLEDNNVTAPGLKRLPNRSGRNFYSVVGETASFAGPQSVFTELAEMVTHTRPANQFAAGL